MHKTSKLKHIYIVITSVDDRFINSQRVVGYFNKLKEAQNIVTHNICDIWEYSYDYAMIVRIDEGLYPSGFERYIYKYDEKKGGYREISEPPSIRHICGFGIG